jgi:hypothetical protein
LRSVSSIVIAPASTGNERRSRSVVIVMAQRNSGICSGFIALGRIFLTVVMKLIAPRIEEIPAR